MPDIPYSKRPGPPLVPDAGTIDLLLHDYLRRADRMSWSPYDLVDHDAMQSLTRPQRLSEAQVGPSRRCSSWKTIYRVIYPNTFGL